MRSKESEPNESTLDGALDTSELPFNSLLDSLESSPDDCFVSSTGSALESFPTAIADCFDKSTSADASKGSILRLGFGSLIPCSIMSSSVFLLGFTAGLSNESPKYSVFSSIRRLSSESFLFGMIGAS
jgi:hypothetical protein